jgi:mRNA interferase MazF
VRRGEIYRTRERVSKRGGKPGFYVVVSRTFVAEHEDVSTVICAPVYGEVLGLTTEVVLGPEDGLPHTSAIRCDFLTLMFKTKLTHFISTLSPPKLAQLNRALTEALELPVRQEASRLHGVAKRKEHSAERKTRNAFADYGPLITDNSHRIVISPIAYCPPPNSVLLNSKSKTPCTSHWAMRIIAVASALR